MATKGGEENAEQGEGRISVGFGISKCRLLYMHTHNKRLVRVAQGTHSANADCYVYAHTQAPGALSTL